MASGPGAVDSAATGRSHLVGRDAERGRLIGLVERRPVLGQTVVVLGEAGMGKSALVAEVAQQARSVGMRVLTATGSRRKLLPGLVARGLSGWSR